jgi:hypothetical protein
MGTYNGGEISAWGRSLKIHIEIKGELLCDVRYRTTFGIGVVKYAQACIL